MRLTARAEAIVLPIAAVVMALLIGAVLIILDGGSPIVAYRALLDGALGSWDDLARTLEKSTPLILTGLAVIVGLKAGLFNIGAQGQLLLGALFSAYVGFRITGLPAVVHVPFGLAVGAFFGMLPAALAGVLKAYRGAHEVITTIMLNSIIVNFTEYMASGRWKEPGQAISRTPPIQESAEIPEVFGLPLGFFIAIGTTVLIWYLISRTTTGFRITSVGQNKSAAAYAGISVARITVLAMCISGALAGLAGAIETQGTIGRYEPGFNVGLGFDGITVALLARSQPIMAIPAALLIGIMRSGATEMAFEAKIASEIIDVILAITLLLVAAPVVVRWVLRMRKPTGEVDTLRVTAGWGS